MSSELNDCFSEERRIPETVKRPKPSTNLPLMKLGSNPFGSESKHSKSLKILDPNQPKRPSKESNEDGSGSQLKPRKRVERMKAKCIPRDQYYKSIKQKIYEEPDTDTSREDLIQSINTLRDMLARALSHAEEMDSINSSASLTESNISEALVSLREDVVRNKQQHDEEKRCWSVEKDKFNEELKEAVKAQEIIRNDLQSLLVHEKTQLSDSLLKVELELKNTQQQLCSATEMLKGRDATINSLEAEIQSLQESSKSKQQRLLDQIKAKELEAESRVNEHCLVESEKRKKLEHNVSKLIEENKRKNTMLNETIKKLLEEEKRMREEEQKVVEKIEHEKYLLEESLKIKADELKDTQKLMSHQIQGIENEKEKTRKNLEHTIESLKLSLSESENSRQEYKEKLASYEKALDGIKKTVAGKVNPSINEEFALDEDRASHSDSKRDKKKEEEELEKEEEMSLIHVQDHLNRLVNDFSELENEKQSFLKVKQAMEEEMGQLRASVEKFQDIHKKHQQSIQELQKTARVKSEYLSFNEEELKIWKTLFEALENEKLRLKCAFEKVETSKVWLSYQDYIKAKHLDLAEKLEEYLAELRETSAGSESGHAPNLTHTDWITKLISLKECILGVSFHFDVTNVEEFLKSDSKNMPMEGYERGNKGNKVFSLLNKDLLINLEEEMNTLRNMYEQQVSKLQKSVVSYQEFIESTQIKFLKAVIAQSECGEGSEALRGTVLEGSNVEMAQRIASLEAENQRIVFDSQVHQNRVQTLVSQHQKAHQVTQQVISDLQQSFESVKNAAQDVHPPVDDVDRNDDYSTRSPNESEANESEPSTSTSNELELGGLKSESSHFDPLSTAPKSEEENCTISSHVWEKTSAIATPMDVDMWYQGCKVSNGQSYAVSIFNNPNQSIIRVEVFNNDTEEHQSVYVSFLELKQFLPEKAMGGDCVITTNNGNLFIAHEHRNMVVQILLDRIRFCEEDDEQMIVHFE